MSPSLPLCLYKGEQLNMIYTTTGTYQVLDNPVASSHVVYASGDFGGATAQLVYLDSLVNQVSIVGSMLSSNNQYTISHGTVQDMN